MNRKEYDAAVKQIAKRFHDSLVAKLGQATVAKIERLNRAEPAPDICHSHDFRDSNIHLSNAFKAVMGREPDVGSDADAALCNAAWRLAFPKDR